jgi:hypothetical protein
MKDPIVEEVRRWRMEHTRKFDGDLQRICEDMRQKQLESGCEVVRRQPQRIDHSPAAAAEIERGRSLGTPHKN